MISIKESIIGRKGTSGSILQQGDIIITRGGDIYMVLTDRDCLKKIILPDSFSLYDLSKGAYVRSTGRDYVGFMNLSSFNDKLENTEGSNVYDIVQVWRNPRKHNIVSSDDINQIIQIDNLELLKKSYKLIWER